jgi:hypothetical protein
MIKWLRQTLTTLILPAELMLVDQIVLRIIYPSPNDATAGITLVYSFLFALLVWTVHLVVFSAFLSVTRGYSLGQTAAGSLLTGLLIVVASLLLRETSVSLGAYVFLYAIATLVAHGVVNRIGRRTSSKLDALGTP